MKKHIVILFLAALCGCAGVNSRLLGKCPCNNPESYMEGISDLDAEIKGYIGELPTVCADIKKNIDTDNPDIDAILNYFKLDKTKNREKAFKKAEELRACGRVYGKVVGNKDRIEGAERNYYDKKQKELCPAGCSIALGIDNKKDVFAEFRQLYEEHFQKSNKNVPLKVKNPSAEGDRFMKMEYILDQHFYHKEEAIFKARTGGFTLCIGSIAGFMLTNADAEPEKGCIYDNGNFSYFLSVLSTSSDGVLISDSPRAPYNMFDKLLFIYTKQRYASGVQPDAGFYTYQGIYSYITVMGGRNSVYSFKKIDVDKIWRDLPFYKSRYYFITGR